MQCMLYAVELANGFLHHIGHLVIAVGANEENMVKEGVVWCGVCVCGGRVTREWNTLQNRETYTEIERHT